MSAPVPGGEIGPADPGGPRLAGSPDLAGLDPNKVLQHLPADQVPEWALAVLRLSYQHNLDATTMVDRAATRKRRDRFRMAFIVFLFVLIAAEGVYAVWQSTHGGHWGTIKDWFS